jgi:hypothetical protein
VQGAAQYRLLTANATEKSISLSNVVSAVKWRSGSAGGIRISVRAVTSGRSTENTSHVFPRTNYHFARVRASVPLEASMAEMGMNFA